MSNVSRSTLGEWSIERTHITIKSIYQANAIQNTLICFRLPISGTPAFKAWRALQNLPLGMLDESELALIYGHLTLIKLPRHPTNEDEFKLKLVIMESFMKAEHPNVLGFSFKSTKPTYFEQKLLQGPSLLSYFSFIRQTPGLVLPAVYAWRIIGSLLKILLKFWHIRKDHAETLSVSYDWKILKENLIIDNNNENDVLPKIKLIDFADVECCEATFDCASIGPPKLRNSVVDIIEEIEDLILGFLNDPANTTAVNVVTEAKFIRPGHIGRKEVKALHEAAMTLEKDAWEECQSAGKFRCGILGQLARDEELTIHEIAYTLARNPPHYDYLLDRTH